MLYTFDEVFLFHNFLYSEGTQLTDRKCFIRKVTDITNIAKKTNSFETAEILMNIF